MDAPTARMRVLAERLFAEEASSQAEPHPNVHQALRVFEKLRTSLTLFVGTDGFTALTRRALALARAETALLQGVTVQTNGSLLGFEDVAAQADNCGTEEALALTSHVLSLLVTFIGESLTLRLVKDAWPDLSLDD